MSTSSLEHVGAREPFVRMERVEPIRPIHSKWWAKKLSRTHESSVTGLIGSFTLVVDLVAPPLT